MGRSVSKRATATGGARHPQLHSGVFVLYTGPLPAPEEDSEAPAGKNGGVRGGRQGYSQWKTTLLLEVRPVIYESIFVCALVLVALTCAALVWLISSTRQRRNGAVAHVAQLRKAYDSYFARYAERIAALEKQSPTELAAKVVSLDDAVARLAKTQQRFQGRFDAARQHRPTDEIDDEEFNAMIALQRATSAGPNGGT